MDFHGFSSKQATESLESQEHKCFICVRQPEEITSRVDHPLLITSVQSAGKPLILLSLNLRSRSSVCPTAGFYCLAATQSLLGLIFLPELVWGYTLSLVMLSETGERRPLESMLPSSCTRFASYRVLSDSLLPLRIQTARVPGLEIPAKWRLR